MNDTRPPDAVFATRRLWIRPAEDVDADVDLLLGLWNAPRVMRDVGYPRGLGITDEEVRRILVDAPSGPYDRRLIVVERSTGTLLGECKLGRPDLTGACTTDVKLLPPHWGRGFGKEVKQGLVDFLFTHTRCGRVRASPNRSNIASQRMQEAVGGRRVSEGVFRAPADQRGRMEDVPYYLYEVSREDWEARGRRRTASSR